MYGGGTGWPSGDTLPILFANDVASVYGRTNVWMCVGDAAMSQVPVKWVNPKDLHNEKPVWDKAELFVVPIVPLSALREVVELVQALDRMCAAHKIQDLDAHAVIRRLLASLGEVG